MCKRETHESAVSPPLGAQEVPGVQLGSPCAVEGWRFTGSPQGRAALLCKAQAEHGPEPAPELGAPTDRAGLTHQGLPVLPASQHAACILLKARALGKQDPIVTVGGEKPQPAGICTAEQVIRAGPPLLQLRCTRC